MPILIPSSPIILNNGVDLTKIGIYAQSNIQTVTIDFTDTGDYGYLGESGSLLVSFSLSGGGWQSSVWNIGYAEAYYSVSYVFETNVCVCGFSVSNSSNITRFPMTNTTYAISYLEPDTNFRRCAFMMKISGKTIYVGTRFGYVWSENNKPKTVTIYYVEI